MFFVLLKFYFNANANFLLHDEYTRHKHRKGKITHDQKIVMRKRKLYAATRIEIDKVIGAYI